jgi:hypothetical protein
MQGCTETGAGWQLRMVRGRCLSDARLCAAAMAGGHTFCAYLQEPYRIALIFFTEDVRFINEKRILRLTAVEVCSEI